MTMRIARRRLLLLAAVASASASAAPDYTIEPPTPMPRNGYIEAGLGHHRLSGANPDWNDVYVRGLYQAGASTYFNGEASHQRHFGGSGSVFGAGVTHIFDDDWYGSLGGSTSSGGFFLPRWRADATLHRKFLDARNLDVRLGMGYNRAKETYTDRIYSLGAAYYFDAPWIAEGGVTINRSTPGDVSSKRGFGALTWGRDKSHYLTLRHEVGREAYQIVGSGSAISDFSSRETSAVWRQWVTERVGFNLRSSYYTNPSYDRAGVEIGIFSEF